MPFAGIPKPAKLQIRSNPLIVRRVVSQTGIFRTALILPLFCFLTQALAQPVLFDFDSAPLHSPLPINLTVSGITAHFSATGQGYSIQRADTMGFTPVGMAGNCIYPSSVFLSDLLISFDTRLTAFSILYAVQELACDGSATMRVTAYLDGAPVGTNTMVAVPGATWPTATLSFSSASPFNSVVVHYDSGPPGGGCDWGSIFMADNMIVTAIDCSGVNNCSGHGVCVATNACQCDPGWSGPNCTITGVPATSTWGAILLGLALTVAATLVIARRTCSKYTISESLAV